MSIAQRLVNFSDGLSAEGILSAAKGGTGTTTGAGSSTPTISAINYGGDDTATNPAGGATITLTGTNFASGAKVLINLTQVSVVTVVSATQITFTAPALAAGSYILYVVNLDGSTAIAVPGIQYSGTPAWSTAAGTLGTGYETSAVSSTVTATSDSAVTYSVVSGTLPSGVTINASGTISGTSPLVGGSTTYTFTVRATDAENQDTDRSFSLTINPDVVSWSSANTVSLPQNVASTTTLAATSAAGQTVSYAVDTLPTGLTLSGATVSGTPTVAGATITTATATAAVTGKTAQQTITWTVSIAADTYFPLTTLLLNSETTALPFLADASTNNFAITAVGDTKPNNFNPYTPGYYSNYWNGSSSRLIAANATSNDLSTGDWTIEAWVNQTTRDGGQYDSFFMYDQNSGFNAGMYMTIGAASFTFLVANATKNDWSVYIDVGTGNLPPLNTWAHIAITRSGSIFTVWVNGISKGTATYSGAINTRTGSIFQVGYGGTADSYFHGYISNFRVVKGTAVYTSAFTPSTQPLTAITGTALLLSNSNRRIDASGNNITVTWDGDASTMPVMSFDPFVPNANYATYGSTYFDGTGDYLAIPNNAAFNLTADFTVECWFNFSTISGAHTFIGNYAGASTGWAMQYRADDGNVFRFGYGNTAILNSSATTISANTWYHLAVTRSGSTVKMFLNGTQIATATSATSYTQTAALWIGGLTDTGQYTNGYIADARIVKGTAVYTTAFTPPTAPLTAVANTSLLTCQTNQPYNNQTFLDNSSNAFPITRTGNATQGSFSPYGANWSNYFDGTGDYISVPDNPAFTMGAGNFTIECWVYLTGLAQQVFIGTCNAAGSQGSMSFILGLSGTALPQIGVGYGGSMYISTFGTALVTNQWYHLAGVRNGAMVNVYVNGVKGPDVNMGTLAITDSTETVAIGRNGAGNFEYVTGYISNARIVKGTAVYTAAFTPPTTPLTAISGTQLLTCQSPNFTDNSPNSFTVTKFGDVRVQKFNPFATVTQTPNTHSVGFDGTGDYLTLPSSSNLVLGSGDFCVEMWYYQQANAFAALFSNAVSSGGGDAQFELQIAASTFYPTVLAWATTFLTSSVASTPNAWNHIAVCRNGTTLSMFLNGTRVATTTTSNNFSSTNAFHISRQAAAAAGYINGYISNLRVVKGSSVYTPSATTIAVPTQPLTAVANTQLLTCQSSTLIDNSVNQFAITAVGDTKPRQQNPFGSTTSSAQDYTPAVFGSSAYFDGSGNDYLSIANSTNLNLNSNDFTIESWWYPIASSDQNIIAKWWTGGNQWVVQWRGAGYFRFAVNSSTLSDFSVTLPLNSWCHFAFVRRGTSLNFYFNGVKHSAVGTLGSITATTDITTIGQFANSGTENLSGYLSDMRVVIGSALYLNSFTPPVAPLTAVTNTTLLLNMDKSAISDKSGKVVLESVGDAKVSTAQKKYGSSSMYFDGTGDYLSIPNNPVFNFGTGDFTVEAWIYLPTVTNVGIIGFGSGGFFVQINTSTNIHISQANVVDLGDFTISPAISANTWYHLAMTRAGTSMRAFINGVQQGSTVTNSTNFTATNATIVGGHPGPILLYSGYIDDLRVTRGYARYTANFTPPSSALLTK